MTKFNCNCICKNVCHWRIELEQFFYRFAHPSDVSSGDFNWEEIIKTIEKCCPFRKHTQRRLKELCQENKKEQK